MGQNRSILIYTHAMSGGGAERVCALLASGFARAGHDVTLAVDFDSPDNDAYVDPLVRRLTLGGGHARAVWKLAARLRRTRPDIAVSALGISNLKLTAAALLSGNLARTVLTCHGFADAEPQFLSQLAFWLMPATSRLTAATVAVSDSLRDDLIARWKASPQRTVRVYNPVEVRQAATPRNIRPPMVLSVGRLTPEKNFPGLVRAFARLQHAGATLLILGEGPERAAIEAEIARLGLQQRVRLPGYVAEPWQAYRDATCFALASRRETFSLVVVEALANGLPVVSTASRGPEEILDHGRFGTIVPYDDADAMARALDKALADPGQPGPRMERAQAFNLDAALENYSLLFDRVIARPGPRPTD